MNLSKMMRPLAYLVMAAAFAWLVHVALRYEEAASSTSWPTVQGVVTRSEPHHVDGISYAPGGWLALVVYHYDVGGMTYHGDRRTLAVPHVRSRAQAERLVSRFPAGSKVAVHYDPEHPDRSVLLPGAHQNLVRDAGPAAVIFFVLLYVAFPGRSRSLASGEEVDDDV